MLSIPWWLFGVNPEECESNTSIELQCESDVDTSMKEFKTPTLSLSLLHKSPKLEVPTYQSFQVNAKKKSTPIIEQESEQNCETVSTIQFSHEATEVREETTHHQQISEEDVFFGCPNESFEARETINIISKTEDFPMNTESIPQQEDSTENCSQCYPTMFSSFDDTTTIFDTTIMGDIHTNSSTSEWTFGQNEYLNSGDNAPIFRTPATVKNSKRKKRANQEKSNSQRNKRPKIEKLKSRKEDHLSPDETLPIEALSNESSPMDKEESEAVPKTPVSVNRRLTPSRRAKMKVISYREE